MWLIALNAAENTFIVSHRSTPSSGDSRAVLGRAGAAVRLTRDHTPDVESERRRIEDAGGMVRHLKGTWRVCLPFNQGKFVKLCATSRCLSARWPAPEMQSLRSFLTGFSLL